MRRSELHAMKILDTFGAAYGLDIVKASGSAIRRGGVYVMLGRLEERGLVSSVQETNTPDHIGIPRRIYSLTDLGRKEIAREPLRSE